MAIPRKLTLFTMQMNGSFRVNISTTDSHSGKSGGYYTTIVGATMMFEILCMLAEARARRGR